MTISSRPIPRIANSTDIHIVSLVERDIYVYGRPGKWFQALGRLRAHVQVLFVWGVVDLFFLEMVD